ncbi:CLIP domain-containing serine protease B4-like [Chironomus tepperi]|uniref:CLIP domain-containing serine protease B4-like n=1 Tax=Chironomus tepperi TaxID=113505 RepID=UPI00391F4CEB
MKHLVVLLIFLAISRVTSQRRFNTCASGEVCTPQHQCEAVTNITSKGRWTPRERAYLQSKHCNVVNRLNYFCCTSNIKPTHLPEAPKCGVHFGDRIVNGENTFIDDFPWYALIQYSKGIDKIGHFCGGSLINDQYVLTAAHCKVIVRDNWKISKVRLGEWDLRTNPDCDDGFCNEPYVDVPVAEIKIHPEYYFEGVAQYHDIALLKLDRKVEFNEWIKPICLPIDSRVRSMDFTSHSLEVAGYGLTENGVTSPIKKKVELEGRTQAACQADYNKAGVLISEKHICAGSNEGKDSCNGDSGSPLMKFGNFPNSKFGHYVQVGLVSFGAKKCGTPESPGVYVRISEYMDWIIENTKE